MKMKRVARYVAQGWVKLQKQLNLELQLGYEVIRGQNRMPDQEYIG